MNHIKTYNEVKLTLEEINIELIPIEYKKDISSKKITYSFSIYDFNFSVVFNKYYFIEEKEMYYFSSYKDDEKIEICDYWTRDFHTSEKDFDTLNISNISAIKIFGIVNKIMNDFINDYNPSILQIMHISESRYKINSLFLDKLDIESYSFMKIENKKLPNNPRTLIFKENLYNYMKIYKSQ